MIAFLINLLILCLIVALVYFIVIKICSLLPAPIAGMAQTVAIVVMLLIVLIWLLDFVGGYGVGFPRYHGHL